MKLQFFLNIYGIFSFLFTFILYFFPILVPKLFIIGLIKILIILFNPVVTIIYLIKKDLNLKATLNNNLSFNPFSIKHEWKFHYEYFHNLNQLSFFDKYLKIMLYLILLLPSRFCLNPIFLSYPHTFHFFLFIIFYLISLALVVSKNIYLFLILVCFVYYIITMGEKWFLMKIFFLSQNFFKNYSKIILECFLLTMFIIVVTYSTIHYHDSMIHKERYNHAFEIFINSYEISINNVSKTSEIYEQFKKLNPVTGKDVYDIRFKNF